MRAQKLIYSKVYMNYNLLHAQQLFGREYNPLYVGFSCVIQDMIDVNSCLAVCAQTYALDKCLSCHTYHTKFIKEPSQKTL